MENGKRPSGLYRCVTTKVIVFIASCHSALAIRHVAHQTPGRPAVAFPAGRVLD
jgi:hypothetical protein